MGTEMNAAAQVRFQAACSNHPHGETCHRPCFKLSVKCWLLLECVVELGAMDAVLKVHFGLARRQISEWLRYYWKADRLALLKMHL